MFTLKTSHQRIQKSGWNTVGFIAKYHFGLNRVNEKFSPVLLMPLRTLPLTTGSFFSPAVTILQLITSRQYGSLLP